MHSFISRTNTVFLFGFYLRFGFFILWGQIQTEVKWREITCGAEKGVSFSLYFIAFIFALFLLYFIYVLMCFCFVTSKPHIPLSFFPPGLFDFTGKFYKQQGPPSFTQFLSLPRTKNLKRIWETLISGNYVIELRHGHQLFGSAFSEAALTHKCGFCLVLEDLTAK